MDADNTRNPEDGRASAARVRSHRGGGRGEHKAENNEVCAFIPLYLVVEPWRRKIPVLQEA